MYEYAFDPDAPNNTAATIFRLALREHGGRVLDLGSGPGIVAGALAEAGMTVTCLDRDPESVEQARKAGVERAIVGDLNGTEWPTVVSGDPYDVIILADVLEHLVNPGRVLDLITDESLLSEHGQLVISIPNVAHESVIANLIAGQFPYTDTGLLDRTHIRFFTLATFRALCESHGYLIRTVDRTTRSIEQTELFTVARDIAPSLRRELHEGTTDARTYQFIVTAEPVSAAREIAAVRTEADEEKQGRIQAEERLRGVEDAQDEALQAVSTQLDDALTRVKSLEDERTQFLLERERLRSQGDRVATQLRELGKRNERLERERERQQRKIRALEAKLDEVYASETWRVGQAMLWLPKRLRGRRTRVARPRETSSPPRASVSQDDDGPVVPSPFRLTLELDDALPARQRYVTALERRAFDPDRRGVVFAVSTTDLDAGRGDLFTALGLGLALEDFGWQAVYLEPDDWYAPPPGTEVYVSLLAEERFVLDPTRLIGIPTLVAWIRNNTARWIDRGRLSFYDAVLCSSDTTLDEIARTCDAPSGILRIGVDQEVFSPVERSARRGVATTVNQWGRSRRTYAILDQLADDGMLDFPLGIYGVQRGLSRTLRAFSNGPVPYFSLPSLYHQVGLVLDDQQGVNAPYGNVNSRIFEALAAGALPITASSRGLDALGFDELPRYSTAAELRELVQKYSDESVRSALVERLQRVVLGRHTYAVRAEEFDRVVTNVQPDRRPSDEHAPMVAFAPDYRMTNPYQSMIYDSLDASGIGINPGVSLHEFLAARNPLERRRVFHQHWTATILGPATSDADARKRVEEYLAGVERLQAEGGRFVWTVHNTMPHECAYPELERQLRQGIADRADAIHVMCRGTLGMTSEYYTLPEERVHVIPHPSYEGVYPNVVDRETAREQLGLSEDDFVYLCLGQIRPYKGVERLLTSFTRVHGRDPNTRLLLSGAPGRFTGVKELLGQAEATPGVVVVPQEISDDELQVHLAAADAVVLPHRRVLNSGLAMLAITFARPLIAPATGCLSELVTPELGVTFDPELDDLSPALLEVRRLDLGVMAKHAAELSERLRPAVVSKQMAALLLDGPWNLGGSQ